MASTIILLAIWGHATADMPGEILEGKLLRTERMADVLDIGVYGPATASAGEPALLAVMVAGDETTRISSGLVIICAPRGNVQFPSAPPPSVHYIPCRQWSPDRVSEWKQLLIIGPEIRWAYNILPLAHIGFQAGPGALLDSILAVPERPSPPTNSPFTNGAEYNHVGTAFITDETIRDATPMAPVISASEQCQGAHGIRAQFPAVINNPATALHVWVLLNANGKYISQAISLNVSARTVELTERSDTVRPPELLAPTDSQKVSGRVDVSGATKPGLLVAAWIEIYDPQDPELRTKLAPVRQIADDLGAFSIPVNLPLADTGPEADLVYELHVRTEAPDYRSAETVRRLDLRSATQ